LETFSPDGLLAETEDAALKEIIADRIVVAMKKEWLTKTAMAAACTPAAGASTGCATQTICR
jgi:hypothetical protein